jgi:hypothetical protein
MEAPTKDPDLIAATPVQGTRRNCATWSVYDDGLAERTGIQMKMKE